MNSTNIDYSTIEKTLIGETMKSRTKTKTSEIILRDGKPAAVILDIDEYQEMLERLEDLDDLKMLEEMRRKPLRFRKLEEVLKDYSPDV